MALTVAEAFKKLFLMAQMALFDFSLWPLTYRTINQKVSFQRTVTFPYGTVTFPYDLINSLQHKVNFVNKTRINLSTIQARMKHRLREQHNDYDEEENILLIKTRENKC